MLGPVLASSTTLGVVVIRSISSEEIKPPLSQSTLNIFADPNVVFGKLLQGPKLTKISPNKTYAGMIGGYLLSIASLTLVLNIIDIKISYLQFFIIILGIQ